MHPTKSISDQPLAPSPKELAPRMPPLSTPRTEFQGFQGFQGYRSNSTPDSEWDWGSFEYEGIESINSSSIPSDERYGSIPATPSPIRAPLIPTPPGVMDPFEVRIRFTSQLQNLNASVTSATKAAQYALKYRDMDEDLHSCILEQLERNNMNIRANIMYFLEHLCDMASRENHLDYIRMMQRDILRIVDAVAPDDGSGAANVKVVRKVLQGLQAKNFLLEQTVGELEEFLKERDTAPGELGMSSPVAAGADVGMSGLDSLAPTPRGGKGTSSTQRLDKKQIEQRIEEDRERHKRQRETSWAIPKPVVTPGASVAQATELFSKSEFDDLWENTSEVGEDDFEQYEEEAKEREACAKQWREEFARKHSGVDQ